MAGENELRGDRMLTTDRSTKVGERKEKDKAISFYISTRMECTLSVWYSQCTVHIQSMYNSCTVHVQSKFTPCTLLYTL